MTPAPTSSTGTVPRSRTRRSGVPRLRGHGLFVLGHLIDSVGNGMLLPLGLLYFTDVRGLPLAAVGVAMTVGQALALPVTFVAGRLMDRLGPKSLVVGANVLSAAGFLCFLPARELWQVSVAYLLVQAGINAYFTAQRTLTAHVTGDGERRAWFAFTGALRNVGLAVGAGVAGLALAVFGSGALTWMIAVDAGTYLLAAACFSTLTATPPPPDPPPASRDERSAHARRYLLLVAATVPYVLAQAALSVLVAVYVTRALELPAWSASLLFGVNTVIVSGFSTVVTARLAPAVPRRAVGAGHLLMAAAMAAFAVPALTGPGPAVWAVLVAATVLFSVAEILLGPALSELSVSLTPRAASGFTQGLYQFAWALGMVAAPALFTSLLQAGPVVPWAAEAAACLLAFLAAPALRPSDRHRRRRPPC
ncbi:MFS transporter [Streptomyces sp. Da 82-17]|uniref:MFS transporter n=1 Tax=Streptomyces sp. Da 82-17 TaxID=3377116 RepID=UPI0038D37E9E